MDWHFKEEIKLYVEDDEVQVGFRVSDTAVIKASFLIHEFQYIVDHWVLGIERFKTERAGKIFWSYRNCGPRPECVPMNFVAISIKGWELRVSVDAMKSAITQFNDQMGKK